MIEFHLMICLSKEENFFLKKQFPLLEFIFYRGNEMDSKNAWTQNNKCFPIGGLIPQHPEK